MSRAHYQSRFCSSKVAHLVEREVVRDLLLFLDQVELLRHRGVVLELFLADLEEHFDHVLHAGARRRSFATQGR